MLRFLVSVILIYGMLLFLARVFEKHFIFFPDYPGRLSGDWSPSMLPAEDVWLRAADGVKLHAWWIPAEKARYTMLAFHGNAGNIAGRLATYDFLRNLSANVLALEYRGYGKSEGEPSEEGLYRDAEAAHAYLTTERKIPPEKIVALGQSLGTGVAAYLAAHRPVGGLVLIAPFPSVPEAAERLYRFLPGLGYVLRIGFDTGRQLNRIHVPILVIHCTGDTVLPFALGQAVFEKGHEPKKFLAIDGVCHEEAAVVAPGRVKDAFHSFFECMEHGTPCPEFSGAPETSPSSSKR